MSNDKPRVLLVDDEAPVLRGLERQLFRSFELEKATSAATGLERLLRSKPFDVVVSDMRMPEVNGAEFLSIVRQKWPDTMRIVLTGHADLEAAAMAINEGDIFRFLLKPCVPQALTKALNDAVEQRHLRSGAQELLERAVSGSVTAISDVFAAIAPEHQPSALHAREVLTKMALAHDGDEEFWPIESAALLSQVRYGAAPEVTAALRDGVTPGESEFRTLRNATATIDAALAAIPKLERTRELLRWADLNFDGSNAGQGDPHGANIPWAARAIRVLNEGEVL
ncbi:MAG: response regulator, partial [Planctomycetota bacterium]